MPARFARFISAVTEGVARWAWPADVAVMGHGYSRHPTVEPRKTRMSWLRETLLNGRVVKGHSSD